jgi:hypothetical protein
MYTESEFMDMSLLSRVDRLSQEIQKMVDWSAFVLHNILSSKELISSQKPRSLTI